ncbi:MAG: DUF1015 domain-containing protein [Dehalococcoidales bacterium]|nr:DUF1015 domain-containing protein [Dehalococcoidales bacterium]
MAEIRPFRGVRYNKCLVKDISSVICPPYDIITPDMAQELHRRSEYGFIKLEHGQQLPSDTDEDNKYTRSAVTLRNWLEQGVLKPDLLPALYLHQHRFSHNGSRYRRRGIIAVVRLEEWDKMIIRPHENTRVKPKSDRLNLLWALQANTSPVFAMFEDRERQIASLAADQERAQPIIDITGSGEEHRIWAVTDPEIISRIAAYLSNRPLYIADGHHRYESALNYQKERLSCSPSASGDEDFNFVMMELVDFTDPGLIILSPHRLVRGLSKATLSELKSKLATLFQIEELPLRAPDISRQIDDLLAGDKTGRVRIVLFGLSPGNLLLLSMSDFTAASKMMPCFHSELYNRLDVSIVDHVILEKILGMTGEQEETALDFNHDKADAINRVLNHEYQLAFFLGPVKTDVIRAIADASDRMPRKSTYFYPKPPSGLVFRRLE